MVDRRERLLRVWFFISLATAMCVVAVPVKYFAEPVPSVPLRVSIGMTLAIILVGFYLRVLVECIRAPWLRYRWAWIVLLIFVPILSAYIYFVATRLLISGPRGTDQDVPT
jgi:hypothetical protein